MTGHFDHPFQFNTWMGNRPRRNKNRSPDGWKLCLSKDDKCQLFNLSKDPYETTNLYDSDEHEDVIARLTERIRAWQKKNKDDVKVI